MRSYNTMRCVLMLAGGAKRPLSFDAFAPLTSGSGWSSRDQVLGEVLRLQGEGLLDGDMAFDASGGYMCGEVSGLTAEGRAFLADIENDDVWAICLRTLKAADVDLSYPLLKDVCETIVRRYVESFIPKDVGR